MQLSALKAKLAERMLKPLLFAMPSQQLLLVLPTAGMRSWTRHCKVVAKEVEEEYIGAAEPWLLMDVPRLAQAACQFLNVDFSVDRAGEAVQKVQTQLQVMQLLHFEKSEDAIAKAGMACQIVEACADLLQGQQSGLGSGTQADDSVRIVDEDGDEADEFFIMDEECVHSGSAAQNAHGSSTQMDRFATSQKQLSRCVELLRIIDQSGVSKPLLPRPWCLESLQSSQIHSPD